MAAKKRKAKVLYAGPDMKAVGGIASVLQSYSRLLPGFRYLPTNSRRGTLPGLCTFAASLAALPFYRLAGYNTLHAHGASGKSFIRKRTLLRWGCLLGFRTIFHCHGGAFDAYAEYAGTRRTGKILRSFSAVAVLTDRWQEYFGTTLGCPDVHVIPNIVELPAEPVARKSKSADAPLRFLFMGLIGHNKGVYDLLEAVALKKDELRGRMSLTICGNGEADILQKKIESLGIGDLVKYGGIVDLAGRDKVYRESDVFILPSYIEGLPITLLEAAAYCLPSITTAVGAIPTVVRPGVSGIFVEPGNAQSIADAMLAYINDHDAAYNHGQAARRSIDAYLPEAVLAKLEKLYR